MEAAGVGIPLAYAICKCVKNLTNLLSKSKTKPSEARKTRTHLSSGSWMSAWIGNGNEGKSVCVWGLEV